MGIREQVALDAASNFKQFVGWMTAERMKVMVFQIGPYKVGDGPNALVGVTVELLEEKGYKVDLSVNVLSATPTPDGQGLTLAAIALLTLRAPLIQLK